MRTVSLSAEQVGKQRLAKIATISSLLMESSLASSYKSEKLLEVD